MSEITYLEAIREALFEEMERDENVFCLGQDIGAYGGAFKVTDGLLEKFGEARVIATPMVVRGPSGGYVRGGPFHSQNPEAGFIHTPGLEVVYPATASDAKGLMKAAIRDDDCVLFFEHKYLYRRIKE